MHGSHVPVHRTPALIARDRTHRNEELCFRSAMRAHQFINNFAAEFDDGFVSAQVRASAGEQQFQGHL
jgi:hypothetical protein